MIPTRVHAVIDYLVALVLIATPFIFGFADGSAAQWVLIVAGLGTIVLSLLTRYELGAIKVLPMLAHISIEGIGGLILIASPWIFRFQDLVWWPHVLYGALYIVIPLLTRRKSPMEEAERQAFIADQAAARRS